MKAKIINILPQPPSYETCPKEPRPKINWDTPDGGWVGIWGCDWPDLLGSEILKITSEFEYEVWQPDLKADKIYSHTFENGLTHILFPARIVKFIQGLKIEEYVYSEILLHELKRNAEKEHPVIHLNSQLGGLNRCIIKNIKNVPVMLTFHNPQALPSLRFFSPNNNIFTKINSIIEHLKIKGYINRLAYITYQTEKSFTHIRNIHKGSIEKVTMGCDFNFWHKLDQATCRKELKLPLNQFTMITVARFVSGKQIDKFIELLVKINRKYDFLYVVLGRGSEKYENYLQKIAEPLFKRNKIQFPGYTKGQTLLKYLNSADLYISTSSSEAGPVSVMEAFACELPVFSTYTGATAELMEKEQVGCLVGIKDYKTWGRELETILSGKKLPKILNRDVAKAHYDWENIAKKFIRIYKSLI